MTRTIAKIAAAGVLAAIPIAAVSIPAYAAENPGGAPIVLPAPLPADPATEPAPPPAPAPMAAEAAAEAAKSPTYRRVSTPAAASAW